MYNQDTYLQEFNEWFDSLTKEEQEEYWLDHEAEIVLNDPDYGMIDDSN